jgi:hypothetical protein
MGVFNKSGPSGGPVAANIRQIPMLAEQKAKDKAAIAADQAVPASTRLSRSAGVEGGGDNGIPSDAFHVI